MSELVADDTDPTVRLGLKFGGTWVVWASVEGLLSEGVDNGTPNTGGRGSDGTPGCCASVRGPGPGNISVSAASSTGLETMGCGSVTSGVDGPPEASTPDDCSSSNRRSRLVNGAAGGATGGAGVATGGDKDGSAGGAVGGSTVVDSTVGIGAA